jgi:integrase
MGRVRQDPVIDPATDKPLPAGVVCRGLSQYRARKLVNGRRVTQTFTSAVKAAKWLAAVETDAARGQFVDITEAQRRTLGQIMEQYRDDILGDDSVKRGAEKERGHLKIILEDPVCQVRMSRLTSSDIAEFRDRMKGLEYAPATIVRRLNIIQTIIEHARREWRINLNANPAQMVKRPPGADKKRDRVFQAGKPVRKGADKTTKSEEERLLAACDSDTNPWLGVIVRFAIFTAMRQGEIIGLRWADIDLRKRTATVRGAAGNVTKNGEVRESPLLPGAISLLKGLKSDRGGRVFPIDQNVLKMRYRRAVVRAAINDLTFHDLRHIATSRLAKIYTNPLDLKRVTGHKDLKSLDRYYHTSAEELAARAAG